MKASTLAGVVVAANVSVLFEEIYGRKNVRGLQFKSARLRTSVAQQTGLPEEQRPTWRSWTSRGAAKATAAMEMIAAIVNCILKVVGWWFLGKKEVMMV
jgi:hypothetical protein